VKVGDLVTMDTPLTPERYGVGLIQKIVHPRLPVPPNSPRGRTVYHVLWPDEAISCQYDNEIVLIAEV
jgi:hypothetical protein